MNYRDLKVKDTTMIKFCASRQYELISITWLVDYSRGKVSTTGVRSVIGIRVCALRSRTCKFSWTSSWLSDQLKSLSMAAWQTGTCKRIGMSMISATALNDLFVHIDPCHYYFKQNQISEVQSNDFSNLFFLPSFTVILSFDLDTMSLINNSSVKLLSYQFP